MELFRHCPGCGRRFHLKIESKKLVSVTRESMQGPPERVVSGRWGALTNLQEGKPIIIDVEEFQYAYRCRHCGHEWSEKRSEKHLESHLES
jgi:hypothetical protein